MTDKLVFSTNLTLARELWWDFLGRYSILKKSVSPLYNVKARLLGPSNSYHLSPRSVRTEV